MCDYGWDGYNVGHQLREDRERRRKEALERELRKKARGDGEYDRWAGLPPMPNTLNDEKYHDDYMEGYNSL